MKNGFENLSVCDTGVNRTANNKIVFQQFIGLCSHKMISILSFKR